MDTISSEFYDNSMLLFKEMRKLSFFLKMALLFFVYLFSNYVFDRIDHEDLIRTFHEHPYINIQLPNNTTFKLLITLFMIVSSHFIYRTLIKPIVYPK